MSELGALVMLFAPIFAFGLTAFIIGMWAL